MYATVIITFVSCFCEYLLIGSCKNLDVLYIFCKATYIDWQSPFPYKLPKRETSPQRTPPPSAAISPQLLIQSTERNEGSSASRPPFRCLLDTDF